MTLPLEKEALRKQLQEFYGTSQAYLEHLDIEDEKYFKRYLSFIERYAPRTETVLDLGCGTGFSSYLLSQRKKWVIGMDLSELFLKRGNERRNSPNLLRVTGDIQELPFREGAFDLVSSYQVIETLPDVKKGIEEMTRVLKKKGVLIIIAANLLSPIWPLRDFFRLLCGGQGRPVWCESPQAAFHIFRQNLMTGIRKWFEREPRFLYRQPDLTCRKVVGRDSESVCLVAPIDIARILKKKGFRILRMGSQSGWIEKLFPSFSVALEIVAEKI